MARKMLIFFHKLIDWMVVVAVVLLFLICLYATVDAYFVYAGASDSSILRFKPSVDNPGSLARLSKDAIAWITLEDTNIDYPIMQGKTNEEYLNKDPYGNYSLTGSIFLDCRNDKNFSDPYSLVYGHHMEYSAMFGALDLYGNAAYLDSHKNGTLITASGQVYRILVFASCKADANEKSVFQPSYYSYEDLTAFLNKTAMVFHREVYTKDAKVIALSTCQSAETFDRMLVFGILTEKTN
ncbi:MAG: class B sortase [Clostridia bacterium]|nr:class B sortase [Clostridia bacterium]